MVKIALVKWSEIMQWLKTPIGPLLGASQLKDSLTAKKCPPAQFGGRFGKYVRAIPSGCQFLIQI
jgi:hypothetical protein